MDAATEERQPRPRAASFRDMAKLIPTLPLETKSPPFPLRQLAGFWLPETFLTGVAAVHTRFQPRPDAIFLASFPKSGTTWLKALAFATLNRAEHPPASDPNHPLRLRSPHDCVSFLELPYGLAASGSGSAPEPEDVFASFPSPRLLNTHAPYSFLSERVLSDSSTCRVVYVCRDPKDVLVSDWIFTKKHMAATAKGRRAGGEDDDGDDPPPYPLRDAFELFCEGRCMFGPQWLHVLGYWEASRRRPDKVLFLRYEEMLRDPATNVKKLAEFMGCAFTVDEETAGAVDAVVELCSLDSLKGFEGNRSGTTTQLAIKNASFFRKGVAGDWRNHLTPEMAARLDEIVDGALQGSGLTFGGGGANDSV